MTDPLYSARAPSAAPAAPFAAPEWCLLSACPEKHSSVVSSQRPPGYSLPDWPFPYIVLLAELQKPGDKLRHVHV